MRKDCYTSIVIVTHQVNQSLSVWWISLSVCDMSIPKFYEKGMKKLEQKFHSIEVRCNHKEGTGRASTLDMKSWRSNCLFVAEKSTKISAEHSSIRTRVLLLPEKKSPTLDPRRRLWHFTIHVGENRLRTCYAWKSLSGARRECLWGKHSQSWVLQNPIIPVSIVDTYVAD